MSIETKEVTEEQSPSPPSTEEKIAWCRRATTKVYIAHAITTWGDRMWFFAVSLFLVKMSAGFQLRLAAVNGLVSCCSVIILGGVVGKWVDRNPRMAVAWKSLVIQNSMVLVCALILGGIMYHLTTLQQPDSAWLFILFQAIIIILGAVASLASTASNLSISKDWIVVIAKNDRNRLSEINAACRRIDLTTTIISPMVVGYIMDQVSNVVATIAIAAWNIISMIAEFSLLLLIYRQVPELAIKNHSTQQPKKQENNSAAALAAEEEISWLHSNAQRTHSEIEEENVKIKKERNWFIKKASSYYNLWRNYFKHRIFPAGLGLACLYMTVLAFDAITLGYGYSQGVSEMILGSLGGAGAITGILGTMAYPYLTRKIGIERTGLFGFFLEVSCLSLCVASVWGPGSPFDPKSILPKGTTYTETDQLNNVTDYTQMTPNYIPKRDYTSIIFLMAGIVSARVGLWMTDMTINQIIQEEVEESQRGSINGVQQSLNMLMDLIKFVLVIMLPSPEQFGFLVLASFTVICLGWISYAVYSRRVRNHILPFHRYFNCSSNQPVPPLHNKNTHKNNTL